MKNLFLIILLFTISTSFACRCTPSQPLIEVYDNYNDIIEVKVLNIKGDEITTEILNVYKGEYKWEQLTIRTNRTSCGRGLGIGASYIIYDNIVYDEIGINLCSRITCSRTNEMELSKKRTEKAETELAIIRKIKSQEKSDLNIYGNWVLEKIEIKDSVLIPTKVVYKLNITEEIIYYNLDVNSCQTRKFSITDSLINWNRGGCTKMCCDGMRDKMSLHLNYNGAYQIINNILIITTIDSKLYLKKE